MDLVSWSERSLRQDALEIKEYLNMVEFICLVLKSGLMRYVGNISKKRKRKKRLKLFA